MASGALFCQSRFMATKRSNRFIGDAGDFKRVSREEFEAHRAKRIAEDEAEAAMRAKLKAERDRIESPPSQ